MAAAASDAPSLAALNTRVLQEFSDSSLHHGARIPVRTRARRGYPERSVTFLKEGEVRGSIHRSRGGT